MSKKIKIYEDRILALSNVCAKYKSVEEFLANEDLAYLKKKLNLNKHELKYIQVILNGIFQGLTPEVIANVVLKAALAFEEPVTVTFGKDDDTTIEAADESVESQIPDDVKILVTRLLEGRDLMNAKAAFEALSDKVTSIVGDIDDITTVEIARNVLDAIGRDDVQNLIKTAYASVFGNDDVSKEILEMLDIVIKTYNVDETMTSAVKTAFSKILANCISDTTAVECTSVVTEIDDELQKHADKILNEKYNVLFVEKPFMKADYSAFKHPELKKLEAINNARSEYIAACKAARKKPDVFALALGL